MGAWGVGTFENDDASDWVYQLEGAEDLELVRATLQAAAEPPGSFGGADLFGGAGRSRGRGRSAVAQRRTCPRRCAAGLAVTG